MEISEKQLESGTEEIVGYCCIPAVNFRALETSAGQKNVVKICTLEVGNRLLGARASFLVLEVQRLDWCMQMK